MQTLEESLAFLAEHVIATEYSFVVDMIKCFPSCDSWIQWVLDDTAYGAATIVAFRDCSNTEMLRDLRQLWANCDLGAKSIKAAKLS